MNAAPMVARRANDVGTPHADARTAREELAEIAAVIPLPPVPHPGRRQAV